MGDWISVEERLPEYNEDVLASDGTQSFVASRFILGDKEYFKSNFCEKCVGGYIDKITHWMSLPKLPKT